MDLKKTALGIELGSTRMPSIQDSVPVLQH